MSLTYGKVKEVLSQYQGKGGKLPTSAQTDLFVRKVLDYLLITGASGSERKFVFSAVDGVFTAPYELEVPLKVQIDGRIGTVGNKWFEFYSQNEGLGEGALAAADVLFEDPNSYYTVYDLPSGGARVGVAATVDECEGTKIIIAGNDVTGREIFTNHKGADIAGEVLEIKSGQTTWSNVTFGTITSVIKTPTKGYTPLYWMQSSGLKGFLADYSPADEAPSYRRFKISTKACPAYARVSVLARIRLKGSYADNDRIPFNNLYALELAAQQIQSQYNKDFANAVQQDNFLQSIVNREANYKKPVNGQPVEVFHPLSAGIIRGITYGK